MSGKTCDKCSRPYSGFGTICSDCRKTKGASDTVASAANAGYGSSKCVGCGKTAYPVERIQVEGEIFHRPCFVCSYCHNKLSTGSFAKSSEGKYYCKVHYQQLLRSSGGKYGKVDEVSKNMSESGGKDPFSHAPASTAAAAEPMPTVVEAAAEGKEEGEVAEVDRFVFEEAAKRWKVENQIGGTITIDKQEIGHTVLVVGCTDLQVMIKGKVSVVHLEGNRNAEVVMDEVLSSVDVSNCKKMKFQIQGSCPTANIHTTDSCNIFLMSEEAKKCQITTCKHSDVQLTYMQGEDPVEKAIPEQFSHFILKDHTIKSNVSNLYSGGAETKADAQFERMDSVTYPEVEGAVDSRCVRQDDGKRWIIENQNGGEPIKLFGQEKHHTLLIDKCQNATVFVTGRINAVSINACSMTKVVMDQITSTVDVTNSEKVQFQVNATCPTASINKTNGCNVFLMSEASKNILLSTSHHSDVLMTFIVGEESVEKPIPSQFVHTLQADGTIKSEVQNLYA